jgi:hypothetical protein
MDSRHCEQRGHNLAAPAELIYELLDAHADTAALASGLQPDERWSAHLDYLRSLQRLTRRFLAEVGTEERAFADAAVAERSRPRHFVTGGGEVSMAADVSSMNAVPQRVARGHASAPRLATPQRADGPGKRGD